LMVLLSAALAAIELKARTTVIKTSTRFTNYLQELQISNT
jgi:hypothetical protein